MPAFFIPTLKTTGSKDLEPNSSAPNMLRHSIPSNKPVVWRQKLIGVSTLSCCALFLSLCPALAQDAPTPQKAPRTPVHKLDLATKTSGPLSRIIEGTATVLDAERLRLKDADIRLFGIVPPQLSAPLGPQARSLLDKINAAGPISCTIRDRDRDGRFLATCRNAQQLDFAHELLKHGLAVTARGSLHNSDLASSYLAIEQMAQSQKIGLWAPPASPQEAPIQPKSSAAKDLAALTQQPDIENEATKQQQQPQHQPFITYPLDYYLSANSDITSANLPKAIDDNKNAAIKATNPNPSFDDVSMLMTDIAPPNFLITYQLLISGLLLCLTTAFCAACFLYMRLREQREKVRSVAAAIRGELLAARSICVSRLSVMASFQEDKTNVSAPNISSATSWPRIRTTVFQAYVGNLGLLGSELSRKIASIYGQTTDYAAYFATTPQTQIDVVSASKLKALDCLVLYIDEVLPRLAVLENTNVHGTTNKQNHLFSKNTNTPNRPTPTQQATIAKQTTSSNTPQPALTQQERTTPPLETKPLERKDEQNEETALNSSTHEPEQQDIKSDQHTEFTAQSIEEQPQTDTTNIAFNMHQALISKQSPPIALWDKIRNFTTSHFSIPKSRPSSDLDYGVLSPEEMEALAYGEGPAAELAAQEGLIQKPRKRA